MSDTTTSRTPYPDRQFTNPIYLALSRNIKIRPIATKLKNLDPDPVPASGEVVVERHWGCRAGFQFRAKLL